MSQFSYADYTSSLNQEQSKQNSARVGWFKLANDGDEALVRFNVSSVEDLKFATIHQLGAAQKWMKISCLEPFGGQGDSCPLCKAVAAGNTSIGKASKRVYVEMLVSYKDRTTGQWSSPMPVVWDKPAGFAREIATKIQNFGDLKQCLFKITRNGAAGDMKTTYSMDYAVPAIFKPELIPADFSAFANFKVEKHSYWEKSLEEVETFLRTGAFPVAETSTQPQTAQAATTFTQAASTATQQTANANWFVDNQPKTTAPVQTETSAASTPKPTFTGFTF